MTNQSESLRERVLKELDPDFKTYAPDQGMPDTVWELNDAQIDYIITKAKAEERKKIIHSWNKAEQRLDGTTQGALNCIEQFRNVLQDNK